MAKSLLVEQQQQILHLTLNRPECCNAFDDRLIAELIQALDHANSDTNIRAVVIKGNGKHFSAGADLNWMQRMANFSEADNTEDALQLATLMQRLDELNKPTIASVQGAAMGGATGLLCCCDIVVASHNSRFAFSEVKLGLIPAVISPYVVRTIGTRQARRYFLTAETINAETAQSIGLVHQLALEDELTDLTTQLIQQLLANGPKAIAAAKRLIRDVWQQAIDEPLITETAKRIATIRVSQEGQNGLHAFLTKQKPSWSQ